jgi:glycosyltransferase involved in cell wall biosynthesis
MKISLVIPAFNEAQSIQTLYTEIISHIPTDYEIIFIDDGSTDDTFAQMDILARADKNVKIIKFRKNFGKSEALNIGFQNTTGDIIFTLDADLQDDPAEIPAFIEKINQGFDLVSGWKAKRHDPISKTIPSKLFNLITSSAFALKLHDHNCGFKAYKKSVISEIDIYGEMHRYIPALANAKGFTIAEIPINHRTRKYGKSKYGLNRFIRGFLDLLTVKIITKFNRSPLYLFGGIGTLLASAGFGIGLYLAILRILKIIYLSDRPLLFLAILLILVGLQFISIGLISELLINQTRKLNRSSIVSVEKMVNLQ